LNTLYNKVYSFNSFNFFSSEVKVMESGHSPDGTGEGRLPNNDPPPASVTAGR
jgi:hypothetical protein